MTSSNGNILCVTGPLWIDWSPLESPHKGQWRRALIFLNIRLSKQSRSRLFKTPSPSLWRHCNAEMSIKTSPFTCLYSGVCSCWYQMTHPSFALLALCEGNPPVTGGFSSQRASNSERISMWWRLHATIMLQYNEPRAHGTSIWFG